MLMIAAGAMAVDYPIVDTGQIRCYDDRTEIEFPKVGNSWSGQDAQYAGNQPSYKDHSDGTVSDLGAGLMWTQDPGEKKTWTEAVAGAEKCKTGGYDDWRLPTIKELYSLVNFSGIDPDPRSATGTVPFIDTDFFKFQYGKEEDGDRIIDSQWATSTIYEGKVMRGARAMFGVNFADGRIKGYPVDDMPGCGAKTFYVIYVRGNEKYGQNDFVDNGDGTVTDRATGLTWMQADSGKGMDWEEALEYAEKMKFAGHDDWRLPNAKELQSIVDYSRCPDTTDSAAIDPVFQCSEITNEAGQKDFGHYWSSTTHVGRDGSRAAYIAFGRALGYMKGRQTGQSSWMDVHGAGAQRSDQKTGDESQLPQDHGPQGDVQRINNMVRLVRGGTAEPVASGPKVEKQSGLRQGPRGGSGGFMEREDRNSDGKVTHGEFRGPPGLSDAERAEHFDRLDRNGDGVITEDEAPTGLPFGGSGGRR
ncbi:DUF1566 domain-containing protein [Tichowtungia aerotolerans]|uniref:DUF1566 domain-containing protein n=2 Tax=Tichowtungia aerotolerans TaxID=2697043 RepID=A0A6P1M8J0_9BACT|nr:DUF1566 domain-containing protein [Tichowtungia aerotolerans]